MKKVLAAVLTIVALSSSALVVAPQPAAAAVDAFEVCKIKTATSEKPTICKDVEKQDGVANPVIDVLRTVLNILSVVAGVAAVLLLIINGLRLILSNGDTNGVKNARSGILYVIVGVIVVVFAQSIVVFVLDKL